MMRVSINGFGRIGRVVLRAALAKDVLGDSFELAAINDLGGAKNAAQLLKYDSVHGKLNANLEYGEDWISIDGYKIPVTSERDPQKLPWKDMEVDTVLECTGVFRDREGANKHLSAGAKRVMISAPAKGEVDGTFVIGVNHKDYDGQKHKIFSMASCTTNCMAPVTKLIHDNCRIKEGFMTTVHAYTNDQRVLDVYHKDPRRARAAAVNIIPTTTGAAKAVGEVIPELKGKLDGSALRVPIPCGSITDMTFVLENVKSAQEINGLMQEAAEGELKGIMEYSQEPLVSTDIVGNPHSSIFDSGFTKVIGNTAKMLSWYDNEWGYSNRMVDMVTDVL
jgi:glyceraldehyde 3-phosphate dehydrogenase